MPSFNIFTPPKLRLRIVRWAEVFRFGYMVVFTKILLYVMSIAASRSNVSFIVMFCVQLI